jgi:hypothetical protein
MLWAAVFTERPLKAKPSTAQLQLLGRYRNSPTGEKYMVYDDGIRQGTQPLSHQAS